MALCINRIADIVVDTSTTATETKTARSHNHLFESSPTRPLEPCSCVILPPVLVPTKTKFLLQHGANRHRNHDGHQDSKGGRKGEDHHGHRDKHDDGKA